MSNSAIHYPELACQLWGSVHHNADYDVMTAVRVYTPSDDGLPSVDELRLAHQALLAAAADVLDQMADLASQNVAKRR